MNFLRVILGEGFSVDSCSLFVGTVADVQKDKAYWKEYHKKNTKYFELGKEA